MKETANFSQFAWIAAYFTDGLTSFQQREEKTATETLRAPVL
jgi:hypothetical protein